MEQVLGWSIPGGVVLLLAVGGYELVQKRRGKRSGTPLAGAYVDEVTAILYGTKRYEMDQRDSMSMMREEDAQGDPPRFRVDWSRETIVVRPDAPR